MSGDTDKLDSEILSEPVIQYQPLPYVPYRQPTFTSKSTFKKFQLFKLVLGAFILFPIRLIGMIISVSLATIVATIHLRGKPHTNFGIAPDVQEGHWVTVLTNRLVRAGLFFLGLTNIEFKGKVPVDYDQDKPWLQHSIVAAPHSGTFDWSLIVARATRLFSPIIKSEAYEGPLNRLVRSTMPVSVERTSRESRSNAVKDQTLRLTEGWKKGWFPVICFPEGTNGNRKQLLKFKAGPFIAGQPLVPVLMSYPQDEQVDDNDLATWPHFGRSVAMTVFLGMCRLQTKIVYTFLDTYYPTEEEKLNPSLYAENVRQVMSKELKKKTSDWTFEDAKLMRQCERAKLQPEIGAIKVEKVYAGFKQGEKHASELLSSYIKILNKYIHRMDGKIEGLLPVVLKKTLLKELYGKTDDGIPEIFQQRLPTYVSFEQLAVVHAKWLTQKVL